MKIAIPSDLSRVGFDDAARQLFGPSGKPFTASGEEPWSSCILVAHEKAAFTAGVVAGAHPGLRVALLPEGMCDQDAWALSAYGDTTIWSPGA